VAECQYILGNVHLEVFVYEQPVCGFGGVFTSPEIAALFAERAPPATLLQKIEAIYKFTKSGWILY